MSTHKQRVRKRAQGAQVLAVIAAAAGGAAALIPMPGLHAESKGGPVVGPVVSSEDSSRAAIQVADVQAVVAAMSRSVELKHRHVAPTLEPKGQDTVVVKGEDEPPPESPTTSGAWQYVGTIVSPNTTAAIVNDEQGKQHFFFAGDKHNATTVVSIASDHIMVRDGEDAPARRVDLQPRLASLMPDANPAAFGSAVNSGLPLEFQKPPVGFDQWNPEQQQQWMERRQMVERQMAEQKARSNRPQPVRSAVPGKSK